MFDVDRGASQRKHPMGFRVCMYKDEPGNYYDVNGDPVTEDVAKEAGFDVGRLKKEKTKRAAIAKAQKDIENQFRERTEEMDLIAEADSPEVRHVGGGKYAVFDGEKRITTQPLTKEQAQELLETKNG